MLIDEQPGVAVLSPRRASTALPEDPSEEELARDWTLSESDRAEVLRCRGNDHRRRFAVQLCVLRQYGRFLEDYAQVPVKILNHLGRQLQLPPALWLASPDRPATESAQQQRIRSYLGYQPFDEETRSRLEDHLRMQAAQGVLPSQLLQRAEDFLHFWKIILPAPSTLGRLTAAVGATGRQEMLDRIAARLSEPIGEAMDKLLTVEEGAGRSPLFDFKEYPPEATPATILSYLDRCFLLESIGVSQIDLTGFTSLLVEHLSQLARKYDVQALKRFSPPTRHAMLACFLTDAEKTLLDHVLTMNEQYLTGLSRRSRHAFEGRHREFRKRAKKGVEMLLQAMEIVLDSRPADGNLLALLYGQIDEPALREAMEACREFKRLEERGYQDELRSRHHHLGRYLPAFLKLPFQAEPGSEKLLAAIELARDLEPSKKRRLPADTPLDFIPAAWHASLERKDGAIDRSLWEIGLALAVRDALRSGALYQPRSRHHVSFSHLIYSDDRWERERKGAYEQLALFGEGDQVVAHLTKEFEDVARKTAAGMSANKFASISEGRLKVHRRDALELSDRVLKLRRLVETSLPPVRIEALLREVDSWCGFSLEFRPLIDAPSRSGNLYPTLLAALIAHGTNLGIAAMGQSAPGISVDMLQYVSQWFLRDETLKAANAVLVNYHHGLPLSAVWGSGSLSSSDGQRFGIQQSSLLASFYPRYFGYYDRAVSVYTHMSNQFSVFGTRVISCGPREALYVLDGLLDNNTILRLREHTTDTHGFTEHVFALSYLLGYSFMPRLRDLADQQLYKPVRGMSYGCLDPLLHHTAETDLIREQWDTMARVAASLRNRTAPANVIIQRLANASSSDRLARALTALGQIVKSIFILRYLDDEGMRDTVQLQLNHGEHRHDLTRRCLFFANRGEFRTGDLDEMMNKASCLSLLSNAVLVWNTVRIAEIVSRLRASGEEILDNDLARVSPLCRAHIIPTGTYSFDPEMPGVNTAYNTLP